MRYINQDSHQRPSSSHVPGTVPSALHMDSHFILITLSGKRDLITTITQM
jgi:hypothetical protein